MTKIKSVVIDDERFTRRFIIELIRELNPAFEVLGEAGDIKSGFELISKTKPDVVFLDIRMPDGSGFELLSRFERIDFEVVFISGFDSYALQAFEFNALDYILKPVEPEKFARNLSRLEARIGKNNLQTDELKSVIESYDLQQLIITKIPVHSGNKVVLIDVAELIFVQAENGYTLFKTTRQEKHLSSKQLSDFDFILDQHPHMIKINKGSYLNLNHISSYSKGITCNITMKDNSVLEVSRRKKQEILELLTTWNKGF